MPYRDAIAKPPNQDAPRLVRCPEDGRVLARMRIGYGVPFRFDYCRGCEGMWFDAGEWHALVERNLHDDLLQFVFDDWQRDVAVSEKNDNTEELFRKQLGQDYERLREIKKWIDSHPRRSEVYAYLGFAGRKNPPVTSDRPHEASGESE